MHSPVSSCTHKYDLHYSDSSRPGFCPSCKLLPDFAGYTSGLINASHNIHVSIKRTLMPLNAKDLVSNFLQEYHLIFQIIDADCISTGGKCTILFSNIGLEKDSGSFKMWHTAGSGKLPN